VHRPLSQQDQGGSADISALDPAATTPLTSEGVISAGKAARTAASSFVVHHDNLLLLKTLS
jgi:hypothetical protein